MYFYHFVSKNYLYGIWFDNIKISVTFQFYVALKYCYGII